MTGVRKVFAGHFVHKLQSSKEGGLLTCVDVSIAYEASIPLRDYGITTTAYGRVNLSVWERELLCFRHLSMSEMQTKTSKSHACSNFNPAFDICSLALSFFNSSVVRCFNERFIGPFLDISIHMQQQCQHPQPFPVILRRRNLPQHLFFLRYLFALLQGNQHPCHLFCLHTVTRS